MSFTFFKLILECIFPFNFLLIRKAGNDFVFVDQIRCLLF